MVPKPLNKDRNRDKNTGDRIKQYDTERETKRETVKKEYFKNQKNTTYGYNYSQMSNFSWFQNHSTQRETEIRIHVHEAERKI